MNLSVEIKHHLQLNLVVFFFENQNKNCALLSLSLNFLKIKSLKKCRNSSFLIFFKENRIFNKKISNNGKLSIKVKL